MVFCVHDCWNYRFVDFICVYDLLYDFGSDGASTVLTYVAIDTETTSLPQKQKIRTNFFVPDLVCMSWYEISAQGVAQGQDAENRLDGYLRRKGLLLVFQNPAFDLAVLARRESNN